MENRTVRGNLSRPQLAYLHHVSLPCRDLEESKRFYIEVLGGELYHDTPGFAEVMLAGMIVGMSEQAEGWTGWEAEYPHYGFNVDAANFALAKPWLDGWGIPSHGWTRNYQTALRYLRDPSGNLLELYCDSGYGDIKNLALGPRQGGVPLPLGELNYRWSGKLADCQLPRPRLASFAHLSVPVNDIAQAKRFCIEVLGGEPMATSDPTTFTEVRVAGAIVGLSTRSGGLHRARHRVSALRVPRRRRKFFADGRVAQTQWRGNSGALDAGRQEGLDVLSRPVGQLI